MNTNKEDLKLTAVLFRAMQHIQWMITKDIESHGLNTTEFGTLEMLYNKGSRTIQTISKKLLMANSSMTYTIDKLEKKKFVIRTKDDKDRRNTEIALTDLGKNYIENVMVKHQETLRELYKILSEEEKLVLIDLMKKLGYYVEKLNEDAK
ncbi:MAG: MarR family transcriptional regulator [Acholeplasmataceae bacterium]|jgi:MarR family 2-MHQ and catechol resistance regulon transcriptional repressor|nr:MarR family transcriptional regulator [Acholeplasmataceae bacterium]